MLGAVARRRIRHYITFIERSGLHDSLCDCGFGLGSAPDPMRVGDEKAGPDGRILFAVRSFVSVWLEGTSS